MHATVWRLKKHGPFGEEGNDESQGQVEKSITEAMTGAEPNNRSRKASHSLRFFKEGLPEPKKREGRSRGRSDEGAARAKTVVGSDTGKQKPDIEVPIQKSVEHEEPDYSKDRQGPLPSARSNVEKRVQTDGP